MTVRASALRSFVRRSLALGTVLGLLLLGFTGIGPAAAQPISHPAPTVPVASPTGATVRPATTYWNWTNVTTTTGVPPPCRDSAGFAYDPELGEVVMFGGVTQSQCNGASGTYALNTTYAFSGGRWTDLSGNLSTAPSPRWGMGFAYDPALESILLFGGTTTEGLTNNETWSFNGTWTNLTAQSPNAPPGMYGMGLTYDPGLGAMLLYGGQDGFSPDGSAAGYNGTWEFANDSWTELPVYGSAELRSPVLVDDPAAGAPILFGGANDSSGGTPNSLTWAFNGTAWNVLPDANGPALYATQGSYDPSDGLLLVFGGFGNSGASNQTWAFTNETWATLPLSADVAPTARGGVRTAWDVAASEFLLFGGENGNVRYNDTWTLHVTIKPPSISATPSTLDVDQATQLNVVPFSGTGPFDYLYSSLPPGCTSQNAASLACTPDAAGSFTVTVQVTNETLSMNASTNLTVHSPVALLAFAPHPALALVGTSVRLSAVPANGTPPYAFRYTGLPTACPSVNAANLSCTTDVAGTYNVTVQLTDFTGATVSALTHFTLVTALANVTLSVTPGVIDQGQTANLSATYSGGALPVTVSYAGLPTGCASANATTLSCTAQENGTFSIRVTVVDRLGAHLNATADLTVHPLPRITSFLASPASLVLGNATTLTVNTSGGTGPFTYAYGGLPTNCASVNAALLRCLGTAAGTFHVSVSVTDARGETTQASTNFTITNASKPLPPVTPSSGGLTTTDWLAIAAVIVVAAGVFAYVMFRRRNSPPTAAPVGTAEPGDGDPVSGPSAGGGPPGAHLSDRILVHLSGQGGLQAGETAPPTITQAGISSAMGVRQNNVANALGRLIGSGLVEEDLRHVRGQPRRLKVYQLTAQGQARARDLRHPGPDGGPGGSTWVEN